MFILFRQAHTTVDDEDGRRRRRHHASVLRLIFSLFRIAITLNFGKLLLVLAVGCGNATIANVFAHGINTCR